MKIDVHCHYAPIEYLDLLRGREGFPRVEMRGGKHFLTNAEGTGYIVTPETHDPETKIKAMDAAGVDMQALSIIIPGCDGVEPDLALKLAQTANNDLARIQRDYPSRFVGIATLPMGTPSVAVQELERAINQLGLRGMQVYSNVAGKPLDEPEFWPIYKKAEELDIPILIHPAMPILYDHIRKYALIYVFGLVFDTTIAMTRLILSGVMEEYPNIKFLLGHLGSTIPYLLGRIDYESKRIPGGLGNITKAPSEYFRKVYVDTVTLNRSALKCAYEISGPDKILFGSDYPSWQMTDAVASVDDWPLSEEDRRKVCSDNAKKLLKIE